MTWKPIIEEGAVCLIPDYEPYGELADPYMMIPVLIDQIDYYPEGHEVMKIAFRGGKLRTMNSWIAIQPSRNFRTRYRRKFGVGHFFNVIWSYRWEDD